MKTHLKQLIRSLLALVFVLTISQSYAADTNILRYSAKVKVNISAADNIKSSVSSYVNRELRSLSDVEIVDNDPEWVISIIAMELKTVGGYKSGVAISTVILRPFNNQLLSGWFQSKSKEIGLKMTSDLSWYPPDQSLNVGSVDDLQKMCKEIVADFDTKYLEESRKSFREIKEILQKSK